MTQLVPWLSATYQTLTSQAEAGRLHHGLLLEANNGMGKYSLVRQLSKQLLCEHKNACGQCKNCNLFEQASHPDYSEINDTEANSIGVDAIRKIVEQSQKKSQLGGAQVFVIRDCEKMTESAANALLKTLEEPSVNTYIMMTTSAVTKLLPTILSRCQLYTVASPSFEQLSTWLAQQNVDSDGFNVIYQDTGSSPLKALELYQTDYLENRKAYLASFKQLLTKKLGALTFAQHAQEEDLTLYYVWMMQALVQWFKSKSAQADIKQANSNILFKIDDLYQLVLQAQQQNSYTGINKKLNYQQLCLDIAKLS